MKKIKLIFVVLLFSQFIFAGDGVGGGSVTVLVPQFQFNCSFETNMDIVDLPDSERNIKTFGPIIINQQNWNQSQGNDSVQIMLIPESSTYKSSGITLQAKLYSFMEIPGNHGGLIATQFSFGNTAQEQIVLQGRFKYQFPKNEDSHVAKDIEFEYKVKCVNDKLSKGNN